MGLMGPLVDLVHELEDFLEMHRQIRDIEVHQNILDDVVEHVWTHHGNQ